MNTLFMKAIMDSFTEDVKEKDVEIISVEFLVTVKYSFSVSIDTEDIKKALALASGVDVASITLSVAVARRLKDEFVARRLVEQEVSASITTYDKNKVNAISVGAASTKAFTDNLNKAGVIATVTVKDAPSSSVRVVTAVKSKPGEEPVQPPSPDKLAFYLPLKAFGNDPKVEMNVGQETTTTKKNGMETSTSTRASTWGDSLLLGTVMFVLSTQVVSAKI